MYISTNMAPIAPLTQVITSSYGGLATDNQLTNECPPSSPLLLSSPVRSLETGFTAHPSASMPLPTTKTTWKNAENPFLATLSSTKVLTFSLPFLIVQRGVRN